MCKCGTPKCIGVFGVILTSIFGLFVIATVILSAIYLRATDFNWTSGTDWSSLGLFTLITVCIFLFITIVGLVFFSCCRTSKCCGVIYIILQISTVLLCFAVSIFSVIAARVGDLEDYVGCDAKYKGILNFWETMDELMKYVDISLCSDGCKCDFTNLVQTQFQSNTTAAPFFANWVKNGDTRSFPECPEDFLTKVKQTFDQFNKDHENPMQDFKIEQFAKYWKYIEEKFECTGWCESTYTYTGDFTGGVTVTGGFYKYLFSDINRGIVQHPGCLKQIIEWLPPIINAYAICAFILGSVGLLALILGFALKCECYKSMGEVKK